MSKSFLTRIERLIVVEVASGGTAYKGFLAVGDGNQHGVITNSVSDARKAPGRPGPSESAHG